MTLALRFPGDSRYQEPGPGPRRQACVITVTEIPEALRDELSAVERASRIVLEAGVGPAPRMGRVSWEELVNAGLEAGILEKVPEKEKAQA